MNWATAKGKEIPISELTDDHLTNILRMLKNVGDRINSQLGFEHAMLPEPNGEMAQVAFDHEIQQMAELEWDEAYEGEDLKRVEALLKEANKRNLEWEPNYAC